MTRDDIIRMAREAGSIDSEDVIETVYAAFAAAERERIKAERQSHIYSRPLYTNGCPVCGLGADGKATGYVCSRGDCPTRITCGGTV